VPTPRNKIRSLVREAIPDGLIWLEAAGLAHPEAVRVAELPFVFEIGRISVDGQTHTVREADLVVAAMTEDERDAETITAALRDYARFVVTTNPTRHARLSGRCLEALNQSANKGQRKH
jgi:hypothetical protein